MYLSTLWVLDNSLSSTSVTGESMSKYSSVWRNMFEAHLSETQFSKHYYRVRIFEASTRKWNLRTPFFGDRMSHAVFRKTEKSKGLEGSSGKSRVNLQISECLNISFSNLHARVEQPCHAGQAAVWSIFKKLEGNSQLGLWTNSANYFWTWRV